MDINTSRIHLSSPHMSGGEMKYIRDAFENNWVAPLGPNVDAFEISLSQYTGIKNAAALSSGTAAIHLALIILGIKSGDEVIASTFTFSATVNPIVYQGAVPILVDSEPHSWNMDPVLLETAIKDRLSKGRKPRAIIVVHLYGMPANMTQISEIADRYEIPVIEDAAEALGSRFAGKHTGLFSNMAIISFNGNKIITTSGGGALLSDDVDKIEKAKFLASQARDKAPHYQHSEIGYNYRMSNIVAGIGRGQMEVISQRVKEKRRINHWYRQLLYGIPEISFQTEPSQEYFSNYWLTAIIIDPKAKTNCEELRIALDKANIEARPLWKPMHLQPVFAGYPAYVNGQSERLFNTGLCLPSCTNLTENDMDRITEVLTKVLMRAAVA